jgi:hypothetical protein
MTPLENLPKNILTDYEVHEWRHASAVLREDFPEQWGDLIAVLTSFQLRRSHVQVPGGGRSQVSVLLDRSFTERGWRKKRFGTQIVVDETRIDSPTHEVDCYKDGVALEVEWNNKDPFFDRDLNNFRLLFELRAVSVGIIITRCDELQHIFDSLGKLTAYGPSTTHMSKLLPKLEGGGGGGCPILVFGISRRLYREDL